MLIEMCIIISEYHVYCSFGIIILFCGMNFHVKFKINSGDTPSHAYEQSTPNMNSFINNFVIYIPNTPKSIPS